MSSQEVKLLRRRADTFLRHAKEALEHGEFDFACFSSEQASQLMVKSAMLELLGEIPRMHRVRELLYSLANSVPGSEPSISRFVKKNREGLMALDEAYIASRYMPFKYEDEDAKGMVRLTEEVFQLVRKVLKKCRR